MNPRLITSNLVDDSLPHLPYTLGCFTTMIQIYKKK